MLSKEEEQNNIILIPSFLSSQFLDYKTMDLPFMESVWNVAKQLHEKNLIYRGFKVMPYSTRCATPISNFEANMPGCYKNVSDPSGSYSYFLILTFLFLLSYSYFSFFVIRIVLALIFNYIVCTMKFNT
jgi:hypothetical protein